MSIYAKVIADSITDTGHRLTTMEVRFHRFVLAEFNTHRVFSRNSASSRAIPYVKQAQKIMDDPAIPIKWASEKRGMQGGDEIDNRQGAEDVWRSARLAARDHAEMLADSNVHKSVINRLLEPFMWHTVIVTSTAWENFFEQRCSKFAQPEIEQAARMMQVVYYSSEPQLENQGGYHLPYITDEDWDDIDSRGVPFKELLQGIIQISVARCARVSYLTHDGKRDIDKDIELYEKLVSAQPPHWSPLEHVAMADAWNIRQVTLPERDETGAIVFDARQPHATVELPVVGNFVGWTQQRAIVEQQRGVNTYG